MRKWTNEEIRLEASKYKTRGEFSKQSRAAYIVAWKRSMLDELGLPSSKWTRERVAKEAARYSTYIEFRFKSPLAFIAMENKGWYDLAKHLPRYVHRRWGDGT